MQAPSGVCSAGSKHAIFQWVRKLLTRLAVNDRPVEKAAAPAQREVRVRLLALDCHHDFLEQRAQQLLAIPVGGGGRGPDGVEVLSEREQRVALLARQHERLRVFTTRQFRLGGLELAKSVLPLGFETSGDQTIVGIDGPIAPFGTVRTVARSLDITPELSHGSLVIGFELFRRLQRRNDAR